MIIVLSKIVFLLLMIFWVENKVKMIIERFFLWLLNRSGFINIMCVYIEFLFIKIVEYERKCRLMSRYRGNFMVLIFNFF